MNQHHIPHFLSPFPSPTSRFIGRQAELDSLHAHLQAGKRTVLVNGLGGVGKTTLAQKYVQEHETEYAHILWLRQSGSIVTSFINPALFRSLGLPLETGEDMYAPFYDALRALNALQGNNLLIIDNYELTDTDLENDSLGKLCTLPTAWRVLCTSRNDVDFFDETMRLDVLPAHEAIQVFQANTGGKPADSAEVGELLKMIGYHTLMTELLAKTYSKCLQFGTVGELHAYLKERSLQDQQLSKKIYVDRQATTLYAHLSAVFSLAPLTETETWVLKQWAVLPTAPHQAKDFLTWIQDSDLAYEDTLLDLAEKGWLQTDNRLAYSLHPFLQLFLHQELKPTFNDCASICLTFVFMANSEQVHENPLVYQWLISFYVSILQYVNFNGHEKKRSKLLSVLFDLYYHNGDYKNAKKCAKHNVTLLENIEDGKDINYAYRLNDLAIVCHSQGDFQESLLLYNHLLEIIKPFLGEESEDYAVILNGLAALYDNMGNYLDSFVLYNKTLAIKKNISGELNAGYAMYVNNLANWYDNQGKYEEALILYQKALQIRGIVLNKQHPDYASSLHNVGTVYIKQGNYQQARTHLTEAYSICLEKLGEQHPDTQSTKKYLDALPSLP